VLAADVPEAQNHVGTLSHFSAIGSMLERDNDQENGHDRFNEFSKTINQLAARPLIASTETAICL